MNANKKTVIITGVLMITGMIAGVLSVIYVIEQPNYLIQVSTNEF